MDFFYNFTFKYNKNYASNQKIRRFKQNCFKSTKKMYLTTKIVTIP